MTTIKIGSLQSGPIGLGCMNLSHAYGHPPTEADAIAALHAAWEMGYRHFDSATLYGAGRNETLLSKVIKPWRDEMLLASKCGMAQVDGKKTIDGRPETLKAQCEASLQRLDTEVIDLYYLHRLDMQVPIEESVGALADLVTEGKIREIGLSEISADTLSRAHAVHPIAAVQSEYSLWSRNPEIALLDRCKELGVTLVSFSPLARGFLCGELTDPATLAEKDIRRNMPRFNAENYPANLALLPPYMALAQEIGCSPAQLALAWVLAKFENTVVIPGTRFAAHMADNFRASEVKLSPEQIAQLDQLINQNTVVGPRYNAIQQAEIDTEEFA